MMEARRHRHARMPTPTAEGARSPCGRGAICHHVRVNSREAVVDGGGGNGFMFRARSQEDAEIFADEFRRLSLIHI